MSPLDAPKPSLSPSPLPSSCSLLTSSFWVSILSLRPQKAFYLGHHSSDAKASSPVPKVTRCLPGPCLWGRLPPCSDTHLHSSLFPAPERILPYGPKTHLGEGSQIQSPILAPKGPAPSLKIPCPAPYPRRLFLGSPVPLLPIRFKYPLPTSKPSPALQHTSPNSKAPLPTVAYFPSPVPSLLPLRFSFSSTVPLPFQHPLSAFNVSFRLLKTPSLQSQCLPFSNNPATLPEIP